MVLSSYRTSDDEGVSLLGILIVYTLTLKKDGQFRDFPTLLHSQVGIFPHSYHHLIFHYFYSRNPTQKIP